MPKKYVQCTVFHFSKGEFIPVDIEVDVKKEIADEANHKITPSDVITSISNEFITVGID